MMRSLQRVLTPALLTTVILAGSAGTADAVFDFTLEVVNGEPIKSGPVGFDFVRLKCVVTNTGTDADSYDVFKDRSDTPLAWDVSICIGGGDGGCYAPFVEEVFDVMPLSPGQTDTVSLYFTPVSGEGSGYATLTVRSHNDNGVVEARTVGCITTGVDVLIVDDDDGGSVETFYADALSGLYDAGSWRRELVAIDGAELLDFAFAVWATGTSSNTLDADDRQAIQDCLAGGGRMLISGQDIAFDLNDPASPNQSAATQTWFETWLNSEYIADDSGSFTLEAVDGDPIAQGTNLNLNGGDGADNQTDPDVVAPLAGGGAAWTYATGGAGAVRVVDAGYRAVFLGFGFEAIDAAMTRATVMLAALDWLDDSLIGIADAGGGSVTRPVLLDEPRPNPFNPTVSIPFAVERDGHVALRIVDGAGRVVRTLVDEALEGGQYVRTWDGRDDRGQAMASGVYFIELRAAQVVDTRKAVLTK